MADIDLERMMEEFEGRFFGKYRGKVVDNNDPLKRGSVQVIVPAVMGDRPLWALPCVPYAGPDVGFFAMPPVDASVWVEFENGNRDHPIWAGCFWEEGEIPAADASPDVAFLRTPGAVIRIEASGTLEIETAGGAKITLTGTEITLEAPSIKHSANGGATALSAGGFDAMNGALKVV
jgi:Type VI secretion system/phage-baseplate injector OB domain